jgi:hypothetical protein
MVDETASGAMRVGAAVPHTRPASFIRFRSQAAVLGVPLRTRSPHVVQIGPIGAFAAEARSPQPAQGLGKIMPHGTLRTLVTLNGQARAALKRPPSNTCIIFKRMFETKFGQESLKIGRLWAPSGAKSPAKVSGGLPAGRRSAASPRRQRARRLAAARDPRYIGGGFPLNRAVMIAPAPRA